MEEKVKVILQLRMEMAQLKREREQKLIIQRTTNTGNKNKHTKKSA